MGDSGNSEDSVPHLHFEMHQPDGIAINPYRSLRLAEWTQQCAPKTTIDQPIAPPEFDWNFVVAVTTRSGDGVFFVGSLLYLAAGDADSIGWSRHRFLTPCTMTPEEFLDRMKITSDLII
jgi:hypothetical protein